jgi:hypothetical protein
MLQQVVYTVATGFLRVNNSCQRIVVATSAVHNCCQKYLYVQQMNTKTEYPQNAFVSETASQQHSDTPRDKQSPLSRKKIEKCAY